MTLEELLAALAAAKAAAEAAPTDEVLKSKVVLAQKAYDDAKAAADANPDPDALDESKLDERTKAYLAKLRKENANHRTKAKDLASQLKVTSEQKKAILKAAGIEDDSEAPEEKIKTLTAESQTLAFRAAILESAVQHGIPATQLEFYEFMVSKAAGELQEGEELTDEKLAEIVAKVKKSTGTQANSTVTGTTGGGQTPPPGASGQITLEKFCSMSVTEKSTLYEKDRAMYTALVTEAKARKKLV